MTSKHIMMAHCQHTSLNTRAPLAECHPRFCSPISTGKTTALGQPRPTSAAHNDPAHGPTADASELGQELGTPHQAGRVGERVGVRPLNKELGISSSWPREAGGGLSSQPSSSRIRPSGTSKGGGVRTPLPRAPSDPSGAHPSGSSSSSAESGRGGSPDASSSSRADSSGPSSSPTGEERDGGPNGLTSSQGLVLLSSLMLTAWSFHIALSALGIENVFWKNLTRIFPQLGRDEDW